MDQERTLVKKLAAVMNAVGRIPKRGFNAFHKYHYALEADVVEALRKELADRNVMLFPAVKRIERIPTGDKGTAITHADMEFTFVDGDSGETFACEWAGAGSDKDEKGVFKAMTGGEKYFLLKTFLIPTGDDPEADDEPRQTRGPVSQGRRPVVTGEAILDVRQVAGTVWSVIKTERTEYATDDTQIAAACLAAKANNQRLNIQHEIVRGANNAERKKIVAISM